MRLLDPVFAMAESVFLDDGSHLDQKKHHQRRPLSAQLDLLAFSRRCFPT